MLASSELLPASCPVRRGSSSSVRFSVFACIDLPKKVLESIRDTLLSNVIEISLERHAKLLHDGPIEAFSCFPGGNFGTHIRPRPQGLGFKHTSRVRPV